MLTIAARDDRARQLAEARQRSCAADEAVRKSAAAVEYEQARARSSAEVAEAFVEHVRRNGLTERIRLSMALRGGSDL